MPLVHWMRQEMKELILSVLLERRTRPRGYFDPKGVERLLDQHFRGRRDQSGRIWRLLMLELWHRNFLESARNAAYGVPEEPASALGGGPT